MMSWPHMLIGLCLAWSCEHGCGDGTAGTCGLVNAVLYTDSRAKRPLRLWRNRSIWRWGHHGCIIIIIILLTIR